MTAVEQRPSAGLTPQQWDEVASPPGHLAHATAQLVHSICDGVMTPEELGDLVERIAAMPQLWRPLVVHDGERRRYRLLHEDQRMDVWVLSWMPGQATGFHDHGASHVALTALTGAVVEHQMRVGMRPANRILRSGHVQVGPAGYIHSVAHGAGAPAVTLHAYSPPLIDVGQYRSSVDGTLTRERQHGRQELIDHTIEP